VTGLQGTNVADIKHLARVLIALLSLATAGCGVARAAEDKALQEPGGLDIACDWLAGAPRDTQRPNGLVGLESSLIDIAPAQRACDEAIAQYPNVARFHYQAGRVAYAQGDYARAFRLFSKAAELGHSLSMTAICGAYYAGRGVPENRAQAHEWCEKAAVAGDPTGMATLAYLYLLRVANDDNLSKAKEWLDKSVAAGSPVGTYYFVFYHLRRGTSEEDREQARNWLFKAADTGYAEAMVLLGRWYMAGLNGIAVDTDEAQRWLRKGAAAGDFSGLLWLGTMYEAGKGVPQDYDKARAFYQHVADSHDPNNKRRAMVLLGLMVENGHGVAQDSNLAQGWYDEAMTGASDIEKLALLKLREAGLPK
jgi:uncharacterized protein